MKTQIVSITTQGQLTIPKTIREDFGILGSTKALISKENGSILVRPKKSFWSLAGSLKSDIKLTDEQLKKARKGFTSIWPRNL